MNLSVRHCKYKLEFAIDNLFDHTPKLSDELSLHALLLCDGMVVADAPLNPCCNTATTSEQFEAVVTIDVCEMDRAFARKCCCCLPLTAASYCGSDMEKAIAVVRYCSSNTSSSQRQSQTVYDKDAAALSLSCCNIVFGVPWAEDVLLGDGGLDYIVHSLDHLRSNVQRKR